MPDKASPTAEAPPAARVARTVPVDNALLEMSDEKLGNLHANALRLSEHGAVKMKAEAERLLPLIETEIAKRREANPPSAARTRKTATRKRA